MVAAQEAGAYDRFGAGIRGLRRGGYLARGYASQNTGGSPFDHAAQGELRARVEEALRQIPEVFRTVVVLREIEGFSYEEIAEILNVNIGTVKSRLTRGRSALRALLVASANNSATFTTSPSIQRSGREGFDPGDGDAMNSQECGKVRSSFSAYLDGAVDGRKMQAIAKHLKECQECSADFAALRVMQGSLASLGPARAPADLGTRLRVAISHEIAASKRSWRDVIALKWENTIRPWAVQISAGAACSVALVGTIMVMLGLLLRRRQ